MLQLDGLEGPSSEWLPFGTHQIRAWTTKVAVILDRLAANERPLKPDAVGKYFASRADHDLTESRAGFL